MGYSWMKRIRLTSFRVICILRFNQSECFLFMFDAGLQCLSIYLLFLPDVILCSRQGVKSPVTNQLTYRLLCLLSSVQHKLLVCLLCWVQLKVLVCLFSSVQLKAIIAKEIGLIHRKSLCRTKTRCPWKGHTRAIQSLKFELDVCLYSQLTEQTHSTLLC